jgi:hypothetical protein
MLKREAATAAAMVRVYMVGESVMWRSSEVKSISLNLLARYKTGEFGEESRQKML